MIPLWNIIQIFYTNWFAASGLFPALNQSLADNGHLNSRYGTDHQVRFKLSKIACYTKIYLKISITEVIKGMDKFEKDLEHPRNILPFLNSTYVLCSRRITYGLQEMFMRYLLSICQVYFLLPTTSSSSNPYTMRCVFKLWNIVL